jgi:tRNA A22 N-methylase
MRHNSYVVVLQAPDGTLPSVASQLEICFVSDQELCQEAKSEVKHLQQEQKQLKSVVDKQQLQGDRLQQQHQRVMVNELQQCQQENKQLRQQLLQAQAQQQGLQAQLDAAAADNQVLEAQLLQLQ